MVVDCNNLVGRLALLSGAFVVVVLAFTLHLPGPVVVPIALVGTLAVALAAAGCFAPAVERPEPHVHVGQPLALFLVALLLVHGTLVLSVQGLLPMALAGAGNTGAFLFATWAAFRLRNAANGTAGQATRSVLTRWSFWAVALQVLLTLPMLGSFGLLDPWETHYGEVAREMIARGDPLSPYWANEGWFRTKPVLDFWVQAIALRATGASCESGQMMHGAFGHVARPEWAIRFPIFLLSLFGNTLFSRGIGKVYGPRAMVLVALVLATTAHFAMLGHQSITDMPLVASVCACFGAWLHARAAGEGSGGLDEGPSLVVGPVTLCPTPRRAVLTAFFVLLVPLLALLVSRNIGFSGASFVHRDLVWTGSAGNETLPGQLPRLVERVQFPRIWPLHQALGWAIGGAFVASQVSGVRTRAEAWVVFAWTVAAVGTLAKGPAGFVIFVAVVVACVVLEPGKISLSIGFSHVVGALALTVLVLPWFVAMHLRHGHAFTDELVMRHMIGRTLEHLHDTNEGDDTSARYYLWQLGYGLFPWTGLVPAALASWGRAEPEPRARLRFVLVAWALVAFTLVTVMKTKFHHYVFPAVPPLAALVGIELERLVAEPRTFDRKNAVRGALALTGAMLVLGVGVDFFAGPASYPGQGQARLLHLFTYIYRRSWPLTLDFRLVLAGFTALVAIGTLALGTRARRLGVMAMGTLAFVFTVFVLDVYLVRASPHWGQRELVARWVAERDSSEDALIAWQMNWKGENFYAGNRVAIFLNGRANLREYLASQRKKRHFAICEHSRLGELRVEVGRAGGPSAPVAFRVEPRSTVEENDKFVLVEIVESEVHAAR
jgi:4-amino-4-deoxy-L-arabinose transferase-like glycosyltransferase